ncbi:hypothetical protein L2E82_15280 [Cichorium intybus]|uniref:Uncharacterized protein n=2 Tax=Cichorium intybus TaxID=13427 RepID=A0ACB9F1P8_CICIN|nr:hypothetical protein L2E82_15278 [Cichorium intybus]KAI3765250.1 hypothetical protein L2E82_15280 [Cichorium intybus]
MLNSLSKSLFSSNHLHPSKFRQSLSLSLSRLLPYEDVISELDNLLEYFDDIITTNELIVLYAVTAFGSIELQIGRKLYLQGLGSPKDCFDLASLDGSDMEDRSSRFPLPSAINFPGGCEEVYYCRWWDCIALPDDVDTSDESSFRLLQIHQLAFEVSL